MRKVRFIFYALVVSGSVQAQSPPAPKQALADFLMEYMQARYPRAGLDGDLLYISVQRQRLFHVRNGKLLSEYMISTSCNGLSGAQDSYCTPTGLHRVQEKIGGALPAWSIIRERIPTNEIADSSNAGNGDVITSRILWLSGLEDGVNAGGNVDSFERAIYIHGTADERSLGTASSHGCVRMRNRDVIELYAHVPIGALVVILDN